MSTNNRVLVAALALGLVLGALGAAAGGPQWLKIATVLAPIGTLWVNAIRMTVLALVISLLITAVVSAAEARSIGGSGAGRCRSSRSASSSGRRSGRWPAGT